MSEPETEHTEEHFHLPPNSWIPVCTALALAFVFVSALTFQYTLAGSVSYGDVLVPISCICMLGTWVAWFRAARAEYLELPESLEDH